MRAMLKTHIKGLDKWLDNHCSLLLILLFLLILRVPNLYEPYWYGDEGIYLTIGQAMRYGLRLYTDIIDHKTPLIYYLAMVPSQLSFRLLLIGWILVTTTFFFKLVQRLTNSHLATIISTLLFVIFTTLPWFEGHIPNGELFVMGFIVVGAYLLIQTSLAKTFFSSSGRVSSLNLREIALLFSSGVLMSLGVLTKVPALFDAAAWLSIFWFGWTNPRRWQVTFQIFPRLAIILAGVLIPILLSVVYFASRGSFQSYLDYGLLYNFRYAGQWQLPFSTPWLVFLFSLPGKALVSITVIIAMTLFKKWISPLWQLIITWSVLALFAATLSNRPYPHYFLQAIPPLALAWGQAMTSLISLYRGVRQHILGTVASLLTTATLTSLFVAVLILLRVSTYDTSDYYQKFFSLSTGKISAEEYRNSFDSLMADNYTAAAIIQKSQTQRMFIWGTNPSLYALSNTVPTGRFTVSFHIKDFDALPETLESIKLHQPNLIVVMNNETEPFPEFFEYLDQNYIPHSNFDHFILWQKVMIK